jgi:hypothetical protein
MPNLSQHASSENLALFAEGNLPPQLKKEVETHLNLCGECATAVMMHRELRDLEALGLLPEGSPLQAPVPAARKESVPTKASANDKLRAILAGVFTVGGFRAFGGHAASPSLASISHTGGETGHDSGHGHGVDGHGDATDAHVDILHPDVRNDALAPSHTGEGLGDAFADHDHDLREGDTNMTGGAHFHEAEKTFGMPATPGHSDYIQQEGKDTCAIQCQHLILNQFGVDVTEDQLVKEAQDKHIYTPGHGTNPGDVGKLLEAHGVDVHREVNANVFNLSNELMQGHMVIVEVDSGELWHENSMLQSLIDRIGYGHADHAVIVSGIDTSDPDHVQVTVTDPGTGDVAKKSWHEFMDAWRTSHFTMVSTTEPAPSTMPEMVNFDYQQGHIAMAEHMPYEFAHELSQATEHETNPTVMQRLENVYMSVMEGHVSIEEISHALGLSDEGQHFMNALVNVLVSFTHSTVEAGATVAFLEGIMSPSTESFNPENQSGSDAEAGLGHTAAGFHDGIGGEHDAFGHDADHHDASHHDQGHSLDHHDTGHDDSATDSDAGDDPLMPPDAGHHE